MSATPIAARFPHMTDSFHDRLEMRLRDLGLSPNAASRKAQLSRETIRKLLDNRVVGQFEILPCFL